MVWAARHQHDPPPARRFYWEAATAAGLEDVTAAELRRHLGRSVRVQEPLGGAGVAGAVAFHYAGDPRALLDLRTVQTVYAVQRFDVPRPRALLGDQHFRLLLDQVAVALDLFPSAAYRTMYLSAAGADSPVLTRLALDLARSTGLRLGTREGNLLIRLRRPPSGEPGWESLVRLGPRPLSARAWRVCNMEGALNAAVAHAMALLTEPRPSDIVLNLACGSGTLLIERLAAAPARRAIGCDTSEAALQCARANVEAAGLERAIELYPWDARALPLPDRSVDILLADLPFGHLVGSHEGNRVLYPDLLREAARVARPGARFALITHEHRLMETTLAQCPAWSLLRAFPVGIGEVLPRVYLLRPIAVGPARGPSARAPSGSEC